jgi:hypothetical protein
MEDTEFCLKRFSPEQTGVVSAQIMSQKALKSCKVQVVNMLDAWRRAILRVSRVHANYTRNSKYVGVWIDLSTRTSRQKVDYSNPAWWMPWAIFWVQRIRVIQDQMASLVCLNLRKMDIYLQQLSPLGCIGIGRTSEAHLAELAPVVIPFTVPVSTFSPEIYSICSSRQVFQLLWFALP